jgi:hypothetical protein
MATSKRDADASTLERGDIFFFYRPRVSAADEETHPRGIDDIARAYMVMHPRGRGIYRLIVIARKRLPDVAKREREWAFVEKVSRTAGEIEAELRREEYATKTRGERVAPAARPAGEGVYALVRHVDHTHLAYALELPEKPGPVQKALEIEREASYILSVKNPEAPSPPEVGLAPDEAARYPRPLQEIFHGRRFVPADPPELLDYPGTQLLLIGASANVREELGVDLDPQREDERTAEIFRDLHIARSQHPVEPLFKGKWE